MSDDVTRDDESLTRAILARTSGSPCTSARELLVPFAEEGLEALDAELVRLHAARCADCDGLIRALRQLSVDLPFFAEMDPGPRFTVAVMDRTRRSTTPAVRAARWISSVVTSSFARPRIAWEAAYVATFLLVLIFAAPGSPFAGVPEKALELAQSNPVAEIARPAQGFRANLSSRLSSVWQDTASEARATWNEVSFAVKERSAAIADYVNSGIGTFSDRGASEREGNADGREND